MNWETWFQDVAGSVINKAADARFSQPYEIDRLKLQALGQTGYYTEGQAQGAGGMGGISPTVLLIGGAVLVAVLVLKD